jgi:peptidoglycan hydrolase-like protein with peptidoglycan-binding domain
MVVSAEHIKKAQEALKAKGLNPGTDGKMDEKTQQALRDFQKVNNLPATGVLDSQTAAKLGITLDEGKSSGATGSTGASGSAGSASKSGSSSTPKKSAE